MQYLKWKSRLHFIPLSHGVSIEVTVIVFQRKTQYVTVTISSSLRSHSGPESRAAVYHNPRDVLASVSVNSYTLCHSRTLKL